LKILRIKHSPSGAKLAPYLGGVGLNCPTKTEIIENAMQKNFLPYKFFPRKIVDRESSKLFPGYKILLYTCAQNNI
jgi:hypothetical protein